MGILNSSSVPVDDKLDLKLIDQTRQNKSCVAVPYLDPLDQTAYVQMFPIVNHLSPVLSHRRENIFSFQFAPQIVKDDGLQENEGIVKGHRDSGVITMTLSVAARNISRTSLEIPAPRSSKIKSAGRELISTMRPFF